MARHGAGPTTWVYVTLTIPTLLLNLSLAWAVGHDRAAPLERWKIIVQRGRWPWILAVIGLGAAGLLMRMSLIAEIPLGPVDTTPDMHRVIATGVRLLLGGEMPYQMVEIPWRVPMGYQPGMFLPYVPFGALGIDTRLAAALGSVAVPLLWLAWFGRRDWVSMLGTVFVVCLWLFEREQRMIPPMIQTPTWWPWLTLGTLLFLSRRWRLAGMMWGVAVASRQPAAGAAVALLIFLIRRVGWRAVLEFGLSGMIAALVLYLPFLLLDPHAVLVAPLENYRNLIEHYVIPVQPQWIRESMGFGSWLITLPGFLDWMLWAQIGATAIIWAVVWLGVKRETSAVLAAGMCLLVFNYLLHWAVWYLYVPPMILFACVGLHGIATPHPQPRMNTD